MANVDLSVGTKTGERTTTNQERHHVMQYVYDARKNPVSSGDVVTVINIPERQLVKDVYINVTRAEGAVATANVGDSGSATQWLAAQDFNAIGHAVSTAAKKLYGTQDRVQFVPSANLAECKVSFRCVLVDLANDPTVYEGNEDSN